jgi:excisionase family DNA binding protein
MGKQTKLHDKLRLDEFLTVTKAAILLGVSPSTLRNWDKEGKLKAVRHPMNSYRLYRQSDLEKLMRSLSRGIANG